VPAPVERIDSMIIADLTTASTVLPVNYVDNAIYSSNDFGRATKGAALTLLAKLYLRENQWQKAADLCKQVMDMNVYKLYPTYAGLFTEEEQMVRGKYFLCYIRCECEWHRVIEHFGPQNHPWVLNRWQYYAVSWDFYNSFAENDERKTCFYPRYTGVDGLVYAQPPTLGAPPPMGYFYMADIAQKNMQIHQALPLLYIMTAIV
jgi:hypothetical protein